VIPKWLRKRENLFFIVTGLAEGILTALILSAGKILEPSHTLTASLGLKIGIAAGCPETVVFFAAEYARQRGELVRIEQQLNLTRHGRLASSRLGRMALLDSFSAALVSGTCAFGGACIPLIIAGLIPGAGWEAIGIALGCLAIFGSGIGYATHSCKTCWAVALTLSGAALAALGAWLRVV